MNVAIIPARGNSKGIPRKNLKLLNGSPLISWTIGPAKLSGCFEYIAVTSEDTEILKIASDNEVMGILRPPYLSSDIVQTGEVCLDALRQLQMVNINPDMVTILQPTSPFRTAQHIIDAVGIFANDKAHRTVISVYKSYKYHWHGNSPLYHNPERRLGRQQEHDMEMFVENGAVYCCDSGKFSRVGQYRVAPYLIYQMPERNGLELDSMEDWWLAEAMIEEGLLL